MIILHFRQQALRLLRGIAEWFGPGRLALPRLPILSRIESAQAAAGRDLARNQRRNRLDRL